MGLRSTKDRYGAVVVAIHWLTAVLIVMLFASGFRAAGTVDPAAKLAILRVHVPIALTVLALTVLRIGWWWGIDRKPAPVGGSPRWQAQTARAVHLLLYVIVLVLIASGLGMMAQSGAVPMILGGAGAVLPDFANYPPRLPHGIAARLLLAVLALHVTAALHHHFIRRDGLLWRMWFSGRQVGSRVSGSAYSSARHRDA